MTSVAAGLDESPLTFPILFGPEASAVTSSATVVEAEVGGSSVLAMVVSSIVMFVVGVAIGPAESDKKIIDTVFYKSTTTTTTTTMTTTPTTTTSPQQGQQQESQQNLKIIMSTI